MPGPKEDGFIFTQSGTVFALDKDRFRVLLRFRSVQPNNIIIPFFDYSF